MKTTVTEEFDADGTLTKRTTVTDGYVWPSGGSVFPASRCTCAAWSSIMPPPPCPVHGQAQPVTITCSSTTTTPEQFASDVGWALRSIV